MAGVEGERPHFERTPQPSKPTEQLKPHQEAGNGVPGIPPTLNELAKPPPETQESQPLPNVWDLVERRVKNFEEPSPDPEYSSKINELNRLKREISKKGTPRDKLILDLLHFSRGGFFAILPEELKEFRSKVEPLSDEEIKKELRKAVEVRRVEEAPGAFHPGVGLSEFMEPLFIKIKRPV